MHNRHVSYLMLGICKNYGHEKRDIKEKNIIRLAANSD